MGKCNIDHSLEDVMKKLSAQKDYLPSELYTKVHGVLLNNRSQDELNEIFHVLKKYDLASKEEKQDRNQKMIDLINKCM